MENNQPNNEEIEIFELEFEALKRALKTALVASYNMHGQMILLRKDTDKINKMSKAISCLLEAVENEEDFTEIA